MNLWIKRIVIIILGMFGGIFGRLLFSIFFNMPGTLDWQLGLIAMFVIPAACIYASFRFIKNPNPIKKSTKKIIAMIICALVGLAILIPGGILSKDLAYGQCMITEKQDYASTESFGFSSDQGCVVLCIDSGQISDGGIICEFKGMTYSWTKSPSDFSLQEKQIGS